MPELQEVLPKYLQIAGYIRDQIVRGDLGPGDEVPSERELAATWGVARPTATKALEVLRTQGLVESRQGSGTYVRRPAAAPRARERYDRARELGTMYSPAESVEFLATELTAGPPHVIEALQLSKSTEVIRRVRLIRHEVDGPIELSTSWFPGKLVEAAPRLLEGERIRGGTAPYVASATGRQLVYARDQVSARLSTAVERRWLGLPRPSAVLVYRLTVHDEHDRPMQFDEATYPPDRWTFRQEYPFRMP
ncbi:MAG: GntR family transcriptional regulator [Acidimicrobiales bacterium]